MCSLLVQVGLDLPIPEPVTGSSPGVSSVDLDKEPGVKPVWGVNLNILFLNPCNHFGKNRDSEWKIIQACSMEF